MTLLRNFCAVVVAVLCAAGALSVEAQNVAPSASAQAQTSASVPPPTIADLVLLLQSYKPDLAKTKRYVDEMEAKIVETNDAVDMARAWHKKAIAAEQLGAQELRYNYLLKAENYALKVPGASARDDIGWSLRIRQEIAGTTAAVRGVGEGIDALESFLNEGRSMPNNQGILIGPACQLVDLFIQMGDLDKAAVSIRDLNNSAQRMRSNRGAVYYSSNWFAQIEKARGNLLMAQGKYDDAERSFLAAQRLSLEAIKDHAMARQAGQFGMAQERAESNHFLASRDLALAYLAQGRLDESELLLRDTLKKTLTSQGRSSATAGRILFALSRVYIEKGRASEAIVIGQWAYKAFDEAGFGPNSPAKLSQAQFLAGVYTTLGRYAEAAAIYDELKQTASEESRNGLQLNLFDLPTVRAYVGVGRQADGLTISDQLLTNNLKRLGPDHYQTGEVRGVRAAALSANGRKDEARKEFEQAVRILLEAGVATNTKGTSSLLVQNRKKAILNNYVDLLAGPQATKSPADLTEAFRLADVARWQSVQKAVSGSALRSAAGTPELGAKIKKVQDDDDELQAVYKNLIAQRSAPPDKQLPAVIAAMEKRIEELKKEQAQSLVDIRRQFPQYDALVNPKPADLSATIKALHPNETLVSIYVTPTGSFVWAVKGGAPVGAQGGPQGASEAMKFHYSPQSRTWLNERVKKLRDATDLTTGLSADRMRYDLKAAHELYQELLAPVASAWEKSDTLLVVANDSLGQIPFSLLTTEAVTLGRAENGLVGSQYRQVPWLARKVAVSYLPSVSALVTLRALQPSTATRAPFLGFGDPDFGHSATQVASATSRGMRNMEEKRVARWDENVLSADKAPPPSALVEDAPELSPLPDTRDEILAIAKALAADPQKDTFFGKDANPAKVKSTDLRGRRIVAFATHGLVAGDLPGLDQPALALTPMKEKDLNSGLLKLDDILKLSLNADLVVLSACNTAAADGEGSEAVSGLGRGFFYAGAKSVLATHWPVETVSARQLVTHLFERYAQDNTMTRAKALQRAMLEVLDKEVATDASGKAINAYAHPAFWAPYALYGDPGR